MHRRKFLKCVTTSLCAPALVSGTEVFSAEAKNPADEADILKKIAQNRPSQLAKLPPFFKARVGATHVAGKYFLTNRPFLMEGADKLLQLGTRLGKFWFSPKGVAGDYPFNSKWGQYGSLTELAKSEDFQELFSRAFSTFILEAQAVSEGAWMSQQPLEFYEKVSQEYYDLTAHLYKTYRDNAATFILQHWEGDWLLRGRGGEMWNTPPADWQRRCDQMVKWLTARQAGVSKARAEHGLGARCKVAHAAEVNRVADIWKGIPTVTDKVLPQVSLDLVSYSCYDGMKYPITLWKCINEIRAHARMTGSMGQKAVYLGEIGVPENEQPNRLVERWDDWMGVALALEVLYVAHWELYCNELNPKINPPPKPPVKDPKQLRGFWLVRPDGSLSESGKYFTGLWQRA